MVNVQQQRLTEAQRQALWILEQFQQHILAGNFPSSNLIRHQWYNALTEVAIVVEFGG